jgi:hypothetical protein
MDNAFAILVYILPWIGVPAWLPPTGWDPTFFCVVIDSIFSRLSPTLKILWIFY